MYDVIVIGGGPAGLSCALVLGRCRRSVLICDSGRYRNERSTALHCYLGHDGLAPMELLDLARKQLTPYTSVTRIQARVIELGHDEGGFSVRLDDGIVHRARGLLAATGVIDEVPRISGIEELWGRSVHVCPYCDGWEHRDAAIAVYGRGDKGAGLALLMRQWSPDILLCTDGPSALSTEQTAKLAAHGIAVQEEKLLRLEGRDGALESIHFPSQTVRRTAMFFNTDQHPRSPLLDQIGCAYADNGSVTCDENGHTTVPGVYVAGDASRDVQLVSIAAAEGARAGLALNKHLMRLDGAL